MKSPADAPGRSAVDEAPAPRGRSGPAAKSGAGRGQPLGAAVGRGQALRGVLARPLASYYLLLASVGLLLLIGLVMVFSATSIEAYQESGSAFSSLSKQIVWAGVGLLAFWVCQRLPVRTYRAVCRVMMGGCVALMVLLDLLTFLGALRTPAGQPVQPIRLGPLHAEELWLYLGPVQLQPAEFAKIGLVLWGADLLARKGDLVADWRELATSVFPPAVALFVLVGYNDFGTMVCLLTLFIGLLWAAGVRLSVFAVMGAAAAAGMTVLILLKGYRMERLMVFLDPANADRSGPGYQYFQGLYAIANGGWFGVGLGQGRSKWTGLPNLHNDFIFAVIAEELGVVGCVVVLAVFSVLAYTGLRIARRVDDPFRRLVAAGIITWLVGQATINIGGVVGLLPITGLPLPFVSDGGSALVVAMSAAGILLSFARAEPDAARALHARPPRRWVQLLWAPLPPLPRGRRAPRNDAGLGGASQGRSR